jgi:hypothetical protein
VVADCGDNAIRRVTMVGVVSTVAGIGVKGFFDGSGATTNFDGTCDLVVEGEDVIVVTDTVNHRLHKIVGGQVTTLVGSSETGTVDGAGTVVHFNQPCRLVLDECGLLLVEEWVDGEGRKDTLRVVEASLAPSVWMGPEEEDAQGSETVMTTKSLAKLVMEHYDKILEDGTLAGSSEGGVEEIEQVSVGVFRVVLRYLYMVELSESGGGGTGTGGWRGEGSSGGGTRGGDKGRGKGNKGKGGKGAGGDGRKSKGDGERWIRRLRSWCGRIFSGQRRRAR